MLTAPTWLWCKSVTGSAALNVGSGTSPSKTCQKQQQNWWMPWPSAGWTAPLPGRSGQTLAPSLDIPLCELLCHTQPHPRWHHTPCKLAQCAATWPLCSFRVSQNGVGAATAITGNPQTNLSGVTEFGEFSFSTDAMCCKLWLQTWSFKDQCAILCFLPLLHVLMSMQADNNHYWKFMPEQ